MYYLAAHRFLFGEGFHWLNGKRIGFLGPNWQSGEPNDSYESEDCVEVWDHTLPMNYIWCSYQYWLTYTGAKHTKSYICKRPKCSSTAVIEQCRKPKQEAESGTLDVSGVKYKSCRAVAKIAYTCDSL